MDCCYDVFMQRKYLVINKVLDKKDIVQAQNTMQAINLYKQFVLRYLNLTVSELELEINWLGDVKWIINVCFPTQESLELYNDIMYYNNNEDSFYDDFSEELDNRQSFRAVSSNNNCCSNSLIEVK